VVFFLLVGGGGGQGGGGGVGRCAHTGLNPVACDGCLFPGGSKLVRFEIYPTPQPHRQNKITTPQKQNKTPHKTKQQPNILKNLHHNQPTTPNCRLVHRSGGGVVYNTKPTNNNSEDKKKKKKHGGFVWKKKKKKKTVPNS